MSSELNFDKAEYRTEPTPELAPGTELLGSTWNPPAIPENFPKAVLAGTIAAFLGSCAYAGFTILTHIQIGFLGLFLGAFIAGVMMHHSGHVGGRRYQVAAAILTYLSISLSALPEYLFAIHKQGRDLGTLPVEAWTLLSELAIASPFLELTANFASGAIGLFILFIAIRSAWRAAAGKVQTSGA